MNEQITGIFRQVNFKPAKNGILLQSAGHNLFDVLGRKRLQLENPAPGKQGRIDLERGVFSSRSDQINRPVLHVVQKRILLGFVKAVDFINEKNRSTIHSQILLGPFDGLPHVSNAGRNGTESNKIGFGFSGDETGQCGFADPGRPPKNHGHEIVVFDGFPEQFARRQNVLLPHKFFQRTRAHAIGQRPKRLRFFGGLFFLLK